MERLFLRNNDDSVFETRLIRYFEYDSARYLIYTLDETDSKGYLKLYLLEVLEELGDIVCYNINDDDYWKAMENIVKRVIKEIKTGNRDLLKDLSPLELNNVKVVEPRYFKLDKKLADILSSNYMVEEETKIDIDDQEIEDLVIEPVDLPEDEIVEVEEENMNNENNIPTLEEQNIEVTEPVVEQPMDVNVEQPIVPEVTETVTTPVLNGVPETNNTIQDLPFGPIEENSTEVPTEPVIEQPVIPTTTVDASDDVNYKELYFAIKEEKEAQDQAFEELMEELMRYKEKYGELE